MCCGKNVAENFLKNPTPIVQYTKATEGKIFYDIFTTGNKIYENML